MWLRKMRQKWDKNGTKVGDRWDRTPIFSKSHFPIFLEVEDPPYSSLCKNQLTALTDEKMGIFATHRISPPRRLVRMLGQWI